MEGTNIKPTVQAVRDHPEDYHAWRICPTCKGGRGETVRVVVVDKSGQEIDTYHTRSCSTCFGEKVIARQDSSTIS